MHQLLSLVSKRSNKLFIIHRLTKSRQTICKYLSTNQLIHKQFDYNLCKICSNNCRKADDYLKHDFRTRIHLNNNIFIRNQSLVLLNYDLFGSLPASSVRWFHPNPSLWEKDSSKVEQTVKALKEEQEKKDEDLKTGQPTEVVVAPKRSLVKRILDEIVHYYHGFRLLILDIGVGSRLLWKVLNGEDLSRREHRQLVRTTSDIFRLVPFSVFIIVPFMELLLPFFIKFFPNMLPSTFQTESEQVIIGL